MKCYEKRLAVNIFVSLNIIFLLSWMTPSVSKAGSLKTNTDSLVQTEALAQRFQKELPEGWKLSVNENATPFRLKNTGITGVEIKFQGTSKAYTVGRPTGMSQSEGFTLWVMPMEFLPEIQKNESGKVGGSFSGAPLCLGSNKTIKVFYLSTAASAPTWLAWKTDVKRILELQETVPETIAKKSHRVECENVLQCIFLGTTGEPNDRVYLIQITNEDRKTYYLRSGDSLGKYIVSPASACGDELVLTNSLERVILKKKISKITSQPSINGIGSEKSAVTNK